MAQETPTRADFFEIGSCHAIQDWRHRRTRTIATIPMTIPYTVLWYLDVSGVHRKRYANGFGWFRMVSDGFGTF